MWKVSVHDLPCCNQNFMGIIKIEEKGKVSLVTLMLKLLSGYLQTPRIPNTNTKID